MSKLSRDVFYLILNELQDEKKSLYSCLLVNKTWCEIIIPILWKNPWDNLKSGKDKLFSVIISHLSDETRNYLSQEIDFLTNLYQKPLFNYISFCKHLNFNEIKRRIKKFIVRNVEK